MTYNYWRKIEYLYDISNNVIESNKIGIKDKNDPSSDNKFPPPISSLFYEGFGIEN